jgi:hypothetical protein
MPASSKSANHATMYQSYLDCRHWRSSRSLTVVGLSSRTCSTGKSRYLPVASSVHANPEYHLALAFSSVPLAGNPSILMPGFVDCFVTRLSRSVTSPTVFLRIRPKRIHLSSRSFHVTPLCCSLLFLTVAYSQIFQWRLRASRLYDYISFIMIQQRRFNNYTH